MSYFEKTQILAADTPSIDAFGRWRVSEPVTLFDSKFINDTSSLYWSTRIVGNATSSYVQTSSSIQFRVENISGSRIERQTRRHFNYQPGKSQLIVMTTIFGSGVQDVIKRVGYYDNNNGLYFAQSGSSFGVGVRTNSVTGTPTDTFYSQSVWNLDKMDGSGPSRITIDLTKAQIFFVDFEWLGVGRIRYGMYVGGNAYYVHQISHINALNGVYMQTPNLPIRYSLTNYGSTGGATLTQICSTVITEGGRQDTGLAVSINNGITPLSVAVGSERVLLAIRKNVNYPGVFVIPHSAIIATPDTNDARWQITVNPVTSSNLSWQQIPNTNMEYATGSTETISGGHLVSSGYLIGGTAQAAGTVSDSTLGHFQGIGVSIDNVPDILVLSVQSIGGTNTYWASWDLQVEN